MTGWRGISTTRCSRKWKCRQSHATLAKTDAAEVARAVEAGFTTIKLKTGRDPAAEAKFLNEMAAEFPAVRWRIGFQRGAGVRTRRRSFC